jgi:hypothetical protein
MPGKVEEADASLRELVAKGCDPILHLLAGGIEE